MPKIEFPIATGFYQTRSEPYASMELSNLYVSPAQAPAYTQAALYGTPGIELILTTGDFTEANRGGHEMAEVPYFVNGQTLYRIVRTVDDNGEETFSSEPMGTIPGTGRVSMADNGFQLCILVPGGQGFIYDDSTDPGTFQEIVDPNFRANGNPTFVTYVDGYFLFSTDEQKIIISALNDGLSYDALDFGSAEVDPDAIVAPVVFRNQVYVAGTETIEVFRNVGSDIGATFPFQRVNGFVIPYGVSAAFSLIQAGGALYFIGQSTNGQPTIRTIVNAEAERISTDAVDNILEKMSPTEISEAFSWTYSQQGSVFVGFTVGDKTLVYNQTSGLWHIQSSIRYDEQGNLQDGRFRVSSVLNSYNRTIVSDLDDGRIGSLDLDIFQEYGEPIRRVFSTLPVSNEGNAFFVSSLELIAETGVGNAEDPEPTVWLERSKDSGRTFTDPITRRIGGIGETKHRIRWNRCIGRSSIYEIYRITTASAVKIVYLKMFINVIPSIGKI